MRAAKQVVRLEGNDAAIRAVAREAVDVLRKTTGDTAELFDGLRRLQQSRSVFVAASRTRPASSSRTDAPAGSRAYRVLWGVLLTAGLVAALTSAAMLGPVGRRNQYLDADLALAVAEIAGAIALGALVIVLVLPIPDPRSGEVGEACVAIVGILCAAVLVFRMIVGAGDGRGFAGDDLSLWLPMMTGTVLLMAGVALRCDPVRRRRTSSARRTASAADTRRAEELRRTAERLAGAPAHDEAAGADWHGRLDLLARRGIDPASVVQARTMTPAAWLAWLAYDGEIEISGVVPRA